MEEKNTRQNKLMRAMEVFGNIFGLNLMFLVFSLPIVTIGASTTALYAVNLKMVRKEEGTIGRSFVDAFKSNFKQATKAWLMILGACVVIFAEIYMVLRAEGFLRNFYIVVIVIEGILMGLTVPFVFPLIARYNNTVLNTFKNSLLLAISNLWSWAKVFLIWFAPVYFSLYDFSIFFLTWYLWLIIVFGLMGYCSSITLRKVFDRIDAAGKQKENEEDETISDTTSVISEKNAVVSNTTAVNSDTTTVNSSTTVTASNTKANALNTGAKNLKTNNGIQKKSFRYYVNEEADNDDE